MFSTSRSRALTLAAASAVALALPPSVAAETAPTPLYITADHVFDGRQLLDASTILVRDGKIERIGPKGSFPRPDDARPIDITGGTVLPGFIDTHTHHLVNAVPMRRALEHGVTTLRDLGGPAGVANPGPGNPRELRSGPILTPKNGYPLTVFAPASGVAVFGVQGAVRQAEMLMHHGSSTITVSLEQGGSVGAPWSHHTPSQQPPWPTIGDRQLRAVVKAATAQGKHVAAYLSSSTGVRRALEAGVKEWAHTPCDRVSDRLLRRAGAARVIVTSTLDTLSNCRGAADNARRLVKYGAVLLYGTDMGHLDVPHGIDGEEIHQLINAGMTAEQALAAATADAGKALGLAPLGQLAPGAPADLIGVVGDPTSNLKALEYPHLVVAAGHPVVNAAPQGAAPTFHH
jgi:imidazolonepropionase-like amidohydrolase